MFHIRILLLGVGIALGIHLPSAARGQGVVEGTVVARATGLPLGDVAVFAAGSLRATVTDDRGRFRLTVGAASTRLVAQRLGFRADTVTVTITPGTVARAGFRLEEIAALVSPVVVSATGERRHREEGSVSVEVLDGIEVRRTRAAHPAALMNRIPGVHVSELSGEGHSMAMRQPITTKPMYLYLEDGIPTRATGFFNHNALYEVNIPQSGGLEVIKGPGTALYGSDAIGGIVNVLTRPAPLTPTAEVNLEGGAYGYQRLLATAGTTFGRHGMRADLNLTHSRNWKDQAPFDRESGTVRWDYATADGFTARTVVTGSRIDQQDVPPIDSGRFFTTDGSFNIAPIAYRKVRALRVSTALERDLGTSLWSVTAFGRVNRMELLPSWQLTFDPQAWDTKGSSIGLLARYRRDFTQLRSRVVVGVDAEQSPGSFIADQVVSTRTGTDGVWNSFTLGERHYDYDVDYRAISPYVHTELSPISRLRADVGVRGDFSGYRYTTNIDPLATGVHRRPASTNVSYSAVSPKIGATFEVGNAANIFASYRHGFRAPSQGQLFQQNSAANTVDLEPVKARSVEVGVRGQVGDRLLYQIASYDMIVRDDIITYVTPQNRREATNAGKTRHRGIESGVGIAVLPTVRVDASYSISDQRYVSWVPEAPRTGSAGVSYSGNRIEQAPRDLASVMIGWSPRRLGGGRVAVEWSHLGRYEADAANTAGQAYGGHELFTVHANASFARRYELFGRVTNLFDRRYAELKAWDRFTLSQYTPGAPRTIYGGMRATW
jgi:iron complex outermembrane receptor protein